MNEDADRFARSEIAGSDVDEALSLLQGEYNGGGFAAAPTGDAQQISTTEKKQNISRNHEIRKIKKKINKKQTCKEYNKINN